MSKSLITGEVKKDYQIDILGLRHNPHIGVSSREGGEPESGPPLGPNFHAVFRQNGAN